MNLNKSLAALILVCAPLGAAQAQATGTESPSVAGESEAAATAAQPAERAAPAERRICRRIETTGQRTAARRVCMTAAEWRRADR